MLSSLRVFFNKIWKGIEDAQMARARAAMKNGMWSRIE